MTSYEKGRGFANLPFALTVDPQGKLYLYCDRKGGCSWIKEMPPHITLPQIERVAVRHTHGPA